MEFTYDAAIRKLAGLVYRIVPSQWVEHSDLQMTPDNVKVPRDGAVSGNFYPYHFVSPKFLRTSLTFENEIPVRHHTDMRPYVNPLYPAYYGLVLLHSAQPDIASIRQIAQYLNHFAREFAEDTWVLEYSVSVPRFQVSPPWTSCIAQAVAALFFLKLHDLSGDAEDLHAAVAYARALFIPVGDGGCFMITEDGLPWFEEYPGSPPSFVLNGFLFGVMAICSLQRGFNAEFQIQGETLIHSIYQYYPRFRCGRFLRYSLWDFNLCNPHYTGLHALLFLQLFEVTGDPGMKLFADELAQNVSWKAYLNSVGHSYDAQTKRTLNALFS